jgi:hypothetical protein
MFDPALTDLLHSLSYRSERLYCRCGSFRTYLVVSEDAKGSRVWSEVGCTGPADVSDREVLAALREELREDLRDVMAVRYGISYPSIAETIIRASILHVEGDRIRHEVVAIEAHSAAGLDLTAHRDLNPGHLGALSPIVKAAGCWAALL